MCSSDNCKNRLPDLTYDGHSRCSSCIGQLCSFENHCLECAGWPNEVFDRYIKHRHMLELNRIRKAKKRAKTRQSSVVGGSQQQVPAHSVSPSPSPSIVSLSASSSVSPYSPTAMTKSITSTPTAVAQVPSDQVVTRGEFDYLKNMMISMASDLAALRSDRPIHSENVPQPSLVVPLTSGVDAPPSLGGDPPGVRTILSLAEGFAATEGESCLPEACPMALQETLDRSRKRSREPKDLAEKAKRQRPPDREQGSSASRSPSCLRQGHTPSAPLSLALLPPTLARSVLPYPRVLAPPPRQTAPFQTL